MKRNVRELLLPSRHQLIRTVCEFHRVRVFRLVQVNSDSRHAVQAGKECRFPDRFYFGDLLKKQRIAVRRRDFHVFQIVQ
ncbi:hypothetical protein D3C73_1436510 [compost metagenome]